MLLRRPLFLALAFASAVSCHSTCGEPAGKSQAVEAQDAAVLGQPRGIQNRRTIMMRPMARPVATPVAAPH
jgi:hypothetical protein